MESYIVIYIAYMDIVFDWKIHDNVNLQFALGGRPMLGFPLVQHLEKYGLFSQFLLHFLKI